MARGLQAWTYCQGEHHGIDDMDKARGTDRLNSTAHAGGSPSRQLRCKCSPGRTVHLVPMLMQTSPLSSDELKMIQVSPSPEKSNVISSRNTYNIKYTATIRVALPGGSVLDSHHRAAAAP